jgi:citrate lyase beta subunit
MSGPSFEYRQTGAGMWASVPTPKRGAMSETRKLAAGRDGRAAALDGMMIDAPVHLRAEQILRRAEGA